MNKVACLVPRIRARPKTEPQAYNTAVYDLPVKIYTEIYEKGSLVFHGPSENTIPLLLDFIRETSVGRFNTFFDHRSNHGTVTFHTTDGSISISAHKRVIWALSGGQK